MKIRIKNKGFPTTQFGYLEANKEYDLPDHFALFCIKKMKSADFVAVKKKTVNKKAVKAE